MTGLTYLWATDKSLAIQAYSDVVRGKFVFNINLALFFIGLAFSSLLVVLTTLALSGQVYEIMPRRYGYVPFTLLLLAFVIIIATLSEVIFGTKRLVLAISVGLVAAFTSQLLAIAVPTVRNADKSLISSMKKAGGLNKTHAKTDKGVLFFVASDAQYQLANVNGGASWSKNGWTNEG